MSPQYKKPFERLKRLKRSKRLKSMTAPPRNQSQEQDQDQCQGQDQDQDSPKRPRRFPGGSQGTIAPCLLHVAYCISPVATSYYTYTYTYMYTYIYIYINICNCSTGRLHACLMHRLPHQAIPSSLTRVMALIPLSMQSPHPT